jgi:signal recognition particle GTPase
LGLPIKYVGTGERVNDFAEFDADEFVDALFDEA